MSRSFDADRAEEQLRRGLAEGRSTQSWGVDAWTEDWRGEDGLLLPGSLGEEGGAWWFRALTDPARLRGAVETVAVSRLEKGEVDERFATFCSAADDALKHWPVEALAPIAFCLREALGLEPAIAFVETAIPPDARDEYLRWLGPVSGDRAEELIGWSERPREVAVLAEASNVEAGVRRLVELGADGELRRLLARLPDGEREVAEIDAHLHAGAKRRSRARDAAITALRAHRRSLVEERLARFDKTAAARLRELLAAEPPKPSPTMWGHRRGEAAAALLAKPIDELDGWDVARLDDMTRHAGAADARERARRLLEQAAGNAGVTSARFVEDRLPREKSPLVLGIAHDRFESAMRKGRLLTEWTWRELVAREPFRTIALATVWAAVDDLDEHRFFRWGGDEAFDVEDRPFNLDEPVLAVAHPAQMSEVELGAWNQRFADFEIIQPFDQLARPTFRAGRLSRDGFVSPVGRRFNGVDLIARLAAVGWEPVRMGAHGSMVGMKHTWGPSRVISHVRFDPRLGGDGSGETTLAGLEFAMDGEPIDPADVPSAIFSEAHSDLHRLS